MRCGREPLERESRRAFAPYFEDRAILREYHVDGFCGDSCEISPALNTEGEGLEGKVCGGDDRQNLDSVEGEFDDGIYLRSFPNCSI